MYVKHGMGAMLGESADVSYDTATGHFVNPKTGADYGTTPPAGYWMPADFSIAAAVAGDAAEAAAKASGATPTAARQANIDAGNVIYAQALAASNGNVVSTTSTPTTAATATVTSVPPATTDYLAMLTGTTWLGNSIPNWAVVAAVGLGLYMMNKGR